MKTHVSVRGSVYIPGPHSSRFASRVSYSGDSTRSTMNDVNGRTTSSVSADLALSPTFSDVATASAASSSSRFDVARAIREARRVRQPPRQRLKEDLEEEEEEERRRTRPTTTTTTTTTRGARERARASGTRSTPRSPWEPRGVVWLVSSEGARPNSGAFYTKVVHPSPGFNT